MFTLQEMSNCTHAFDYLPNRQIWSRRIFAYLALVGTNSGVNCFANMAKAKHQRPNNIAAVRDAKGLNQEQLAERVGISISYLSRIERGDRNISLKILRKISDALGVPVNDLIDHKQQTDIPIVTWVSAGQMARDDGQQEIIGEIAMPGLDPKGDWIALRVEGDSMDRISPPGSIIFVNLLDTALVPNACYVVADSDNNTTYKRFRPNPARFEAVSNNDSHNPIFPDGEPFVVGRVRRSMIDM